MGNSATVSFKVRPEEFAAIKAIAEAQELTVSEMVRRAVSEALELSEQWERFVGEVRKGANRGQPEND